MFSEKAKQFHNAFIEIEKETDLKFVVINKPGAGHNIGYQYINDSTKPTIFVSSDTIKTNIDKDGYPKEIVNNSSCSICF